MYFLNFTSYYYSVADPGGDLLTVHTPSPPQNNNNWIKKIEVASRFE